MTTALVLNEPTNGAAARLPLLGLPVPLALLDEDGLLRLRNP